MFSEEDLDQNIRNSPNLNVEEFAETFQVNRTTVERRLESQGFTTKFDRRVPHQLSATQREGRVMTCLSLLFRYKNGRFLPRIVMGDEKWVLYWNVKCQRTVGRVSKPPSSTSKPELHSKKVTSVGWDIKGIIHWEVLEPNQTLNITFYCQQLDRLRALRLKRPGLVNRQGVIIHHDNCSNEEIYKIVV